jgi:hypothetical protein
VKLGSRSTRATGLHALEPAAVLPS